MRAFRRIHAKNPEIRLLQDSLREQFDDLQNIPFLSGHLLTEDLLSGDTILLHGLGRQPLGWFIVDLADDVTVYRSAWSTTTLTLNASAAATSVKIWVF